MSNSVLVQIKNERHEKTIVIILIVLIPIFFLVSGLVTNSVLGPGRLGDGYIWIGCIIFPFSAAIVFLS